jgi:phage shock protein E
MEWAIIFLAFDFLALAILLGHSDRVSENEAAEHMRKGALVIDVRMPNEYAASHLPNAINIPVTGVAEVVPMRVRDKRRVLLLYGQIGMRSSLARRKLEALGYSNAFNLGSYDRAVQIAAENQPAQVWSDARRAQAMEKALLQKEARRHEFGAAARANG